MAIKKSDLYSSIWAACDQLRGGMDASQYKDYVLSMLFLKYISDKYGNSTDFEPPVTIPKGASFTDMLALKGKPDIGDKLNTEIIQPLIDANTRLARSDFPDFNDSNKLGDAPAMVERLTNLIAIFQNPNSTSHRTAPNTTIYSVTRMISDAALRHREWQEQGTILHAVRSKSRHCARHWYCAE